MRRLTLPSPAMIVALVALILALSGVGYAAVVLPKNSVGTKQLRTGSVTSSDVRNGAIRTPDIRNSTVRGADVRANSLTGREVAEEKLGTVPNASSAGTIGGFNAAQLRDRCPGGTVYSGTVCIEASLRGPDSFTFANKACALAGRALPTYPQLMGFFSASQPVAVGGEWTASVGPEAGQLQAAIIQNITGSSPAFADATGNTQRAFRCAAPLTNL